MAKPEEPDYLELLRFDLSKQGVLHVRLVLVDYSNIVRIRVLPLARFLKLLQPGNGLRGVTMAKIAIVLPVFDDIVINGLPPVLSAVGEFCLVPDILTIRKLPYGTKTHAICHVTLEEKEDVPGQIGRELDLCPRTCLRRIVRSAKDVGISFQVGFESEVVFLSSTDPIIPVDQTTYGRNSAFYSDQVAEMMDEIVAALEEQEIGVTQFHPESGPGQFEFVTDHLDPLGAADALVLTRETISNIAFKYQLKATFAPKLYTDGVGTASHCHISVHRDLSPMSSTPDVPPGLRDIEENFLAGILKHLRAVSAFTMASTNSYARLEEGHFAGVHIGWGVDNREVPLRVTYNPSNNQTSGREYRFEVKCFDGTSNPYMALSAILTAGFHGGIKERLTLTSKELKVDPATMTEQDRISLGVTERLPGSLTEALEVLETDSDLFVEGMGKTILHAYKAVKNAEIDHMNTLVPSEQLKLIIRNY